MEVIAVACAIPNVRHCRSLRRFSVLSRLQRRAFFSKLPNSHSGTSAERLFAMKSMSYEAELHNQAGRARRHGGFAMAAPLSVMITISTGQLVCLHPCG